MKIKYSLISIMTVLSLTVLLAGSRAFADDFSDFNNQLQAVHAHRALVEAQLNLDPLADHYPHATSYYDDLEAHYELTWITYDQVYEGIR